MTSSETLAASEAFRARLSASLAERLAGLRVSAAEELALVPVLRSAPGRPDGGRRP